MSFVFLGEKPYKCFLCHAAFTDYSILRRHLMGIHKQDKDSSRVYLRRAKSIEGVNRGGEKKDTVTVNDISIYRGNFRQVEEHVPVPDERSSSPVSKDSETGVSQTQDLEVQKEAPTSQEGYSSSSLSHSRMLEEVESSMDFTGAGTSRIDPQSPEEAPIQRPLSTMEMPAHMTGPMQSICSSVARQLAPWVIDGRPPMGYNPPIPPTELLNTLCAAEAMAYNQPHNQPHRPDLFHGANSAITGSNAHIEQQSKEYEGQKQPDMYQNDPYFYPNNHSVN